MIDEGTYKAIGRKHYWITMQGKEGGQFRQFCVEFEILEGKHCSERISWKGGIKTDKQIAFTKNAMKVMGWDEKTNPSIAKMDREVKIVVKHEQKDGKTFANVQYVNSLEGGPAAFEKYKMDSVQTQAADDEFMAVHRQQQEARGEDVQAGPIDDGDAGGSGGDDLPFARCDIDADVRVLMLGDTRTV
jgi:hypothetical protein